ncbi:hypothetical protein BH09MYX1_BH09MYX1_49000 [soil metagenome]
MRLTFLGVLLLAGCATDEFSYDDAGPVDGGHPDAPVDVDVPDQAADAIADAADAADAAIVIPPLDCTTLKGPHFCSDFEEAAFPNAPLAPLPPSNGSVTRGTTSSYSPAHSVESTLIASNNASSAELAFTYADPKTQDHFILSFAFRVNVLTEDARIATFSFDGVGPGACQYIVILSPPQTVTLIVKTPTPTTSSYAMGSYSPLKWHHVELDMSVLALTGVTATLDGVSITAPSAGVATATTRDVAIGLRRSVGGQSATVLFDDLLLR